MSKLSSLPHAEKPRERLETQGPEGLSLVELLAIVLGSGTKDQNVLEVASEMVHHFRGLEGLLQATLSELMQIKGVGRVKAIQLKAIFGIALKSQQLISSEKLRIKSPEDVFVLAKKSIASWSQEALLVILRDIKGNLIHQEVVAKGILSEVLVHPREVFHLAIRHLAASVIIAHNHPSGDPTPSFADLGLTKTLIEAGHLLSIRLDDHIIVCRDRFVSLKEQGSFFSKTSRY